MIWFLGKSQYKGAFTTDQNFHRLWVSLQDFVLPGYRRGSFPAEIPYRRPIVEVTCSKTTWRVLKHPGHQGGTEPLVAAKHVIVL